MSEDAPARSEEEIIAGTLVVPVGGIKKSLRVLTIREARAWKLGLVNAIGGDVASLRLEGSSDFAPLVETVSDKLLELVVAYDVDGALGGREWLESHATDPELYAVFRKLLEVSFPFVRDLRTALVELRAIGLADLLSSASARSESSTNGHSTDGDSGSTKPLLTSN